MNQAERIAHTRRVTAQIHRQVLRDKHPWLSVKAVKPFGPWIVVVRSPGAHGVVVHRVVCQRGDDALAAGLELLRSTAQGSVPPGGPGDLGGGGDLAGGGGGRHLPFQGAALAELAEQGGAAGLVQRG